jgi:CspA family cold shock protein
VKSPGAEDQILQGRVKFYRSEKGWGAIVSPHLDHDIWVHFSTIDVPGYRDLQQGDQVEFTYEDCWGVQDSWHYRTKWVRPTAR